MCIHVHLSCPDQCLSFMQLLLLSSLCRVQPFLATQLGYGQMHAVLGHERGVKRLAVSALNLHVLGLYNWI